MLRKRLKEMEHQLYRLAVRMGEGENEDKMLLDVRKSAARSKHLVGELQLLKGKIHAMESDVRHLQTSSVGPH
jgi:coiled-coil domain-containing protein 77